MALIFGLFWLTSDNEKRANNGALWCADLETKKAPIVGAIVFIFLSEF